MQIIPKMTQPLFNSDLCRRLSGEMEVYMEKFDASQLVGLIRKHRVVAIVRHLPGEQLLPVFESLYAGGVRLIEVTMNTAGAASQITEAQAHFGDRMLIGAGTVTTPERAAAAIDAGARFLVTPNLDLDVMALARERNCPVIPGVLTPSEMMQAMRAGAAALKLFPASHLGPAYVKDVLAPLDDLDLVAVGGVTPANAADWIKAGCIGVGMGGCLVDPKLIKNADYDGLRQLATELINGVGGIT
jgi:2-dehydro-3-deoxyphosphogluconate aldolase / (4S)-4-hydroxy-2-oxoglutarate aldolase